MLREQASLLRKINILVDVGAVFIAFWLSFLVRSSCSEMQDIHHYAWILLLVIPIWIFLLNHFGFYSSQRTNPLSKQLIALCKVHLLGGILVTSAVYFIEPVDFCRIFLSIFLIVSLLVVGAEQLLVRFFLHNVRRHGYNIRSILLVGTQQIAEKMIDQIGMHKSWGLRIVGIIQPEAGPLREEVKGHAILGHLGDMIGVCKSVQVDEVIFCTTREECSFDIENQISLLEELGITSRTVLSLYYTFRKRTELSMFHNEIPLMTINPTAFTAEQLFLKRCIDFAGGLVGVFILLLTCLLLAAAIKLESPGPIFFGQTRVGKNGRRFTCWKFRSMYVDAEERKKELLHLNEMEGAIFKIKDDPRITKVGKFLRKTSLDELPQFWNVLRGEMSLVGTRPPTPGEVDNYENWQRKRICIKPGITGLWQVSGRNSITDFNEVVRLDLAYIDKWSLGLDMKILLKTLKVVFLREGAS